MSRNRIVLLVLLAVLLSGGIYTVHFLLGRSDRIAEAKRRDRMTQVERELLRYEYERGEAAASLNDLVPMYLRQDEIESERGPLYVYSAEQRTLTEPEGGVVRGLFTYRLPAASLTLPATSHKARPAITEIKLNTSQRPKLETERTGEEEHRQTASKTEEIGIYSAERAPIKDKSSTVAIVKAENAEPRVSSTPAVATKDDFAVSVPPEVPPVETPRSSRSKITFMKLKGIALVDPPAGAFVFEAENFTETNYAWEAHIDEGSSGGAYLQCKEGIANNSAQTHWMVGNFYDVHAKTDLTYLKYHFNLPVSGNYYCYGRMWTTDTHCSNDLNVAFDRGGPGVGKMDNRTPFRWVWTEIEASPHYLEKGDHYMHIFPWEDGIMVDQYIFSLVPISGAQAYKPNFIPGRGTAWEKTAPPAHISFDVGSAVISPNLPPDIRLFVRKQKAANGTAQVVVRLKNAGKDGGDLTILDADLDLDTLPESGFVALSFKGLDLEKIQRREYVLEGTLSKDDKKLASTSVVLMKPWAWEVFGPGQYLDNYASGPLDGERAPPAGDKRAWTPFKDTSYEWFGVLDFGLQTSGNSKHAPADCTIYARTTVKVAKDGEYKIKVMADDQMVLWLDGEEIFRIDDRLPVTRSARSFVHQLSAGEHHLRMRVNQTDGPWQAYLRIRTHDDDTSDVVGMELEQKK
jgi:hypothetical protein